MDIVERIRNASLTPMGIAADEIERLRQQNAELLKALTDLWSVSHWPDNPYEMDAAKLAIAKATGGEK